MPMPRPAIVLAALALALPILGSLPAAAQQGYLYGERKFRNFCPPGLKYAAGACVRRCPAGYRDRGGNYCRPPGIDGFGR